ncbi:beta-1,4-mannosyl-glycoprotein 4-beta-N-acetylglucosaminyltransferase [Ranunculus cassubicifolius]
MVNLCKRHGWGVIKGVFDAVLLSNELDILQVRWNELYSYSTQFVLLESDSTFTGLLKPLVFAGNQDDFKFIKSRLTYGTIGGSFKKGENPFVEEAYQRVALDQLLMLAGITDDDLLIMSDVDEIPSAHTTNLLRCFHFQDDHFNRVRFPHFLNPKRVQEVICKGADLFDMLPEEYTFKEITGKMGNIPHLYSGVHLPAFLSNNFDKYKFLLLRIRLING